MIYKKVEKIQEEISAIGVGCWGFGGDFDTSDDSSAREAILTAVAEGINLFDVAPVYGWGHAEEVLGKTLQEEGVRDKVLIATKGGLRFGDSHQTENNLTRESLFWEVDQSLTRLRTDHIDIYQLHWPDPATPLEETAEALSRLKQAGKIRYVGMSNYKQADVEAMMEYIGVECQQGLYNMLEPNASSYHGIPLDYRVEKEILPNVKKFGQAFLPYSPLFQGLLAGRFNEGNPLSEKDIRQANPKLSGLEFSLYQKAACDLTALGEKYGKPLNEIALNWLRRQEAVTSIIAGVSSVRQMEQNLHSLTWDMDDGMMAEIAKITAPFENR